MNYSEIRSIKALDAARDELSVRIARKAVEVGRNYENVLESYSAASITASAIKGVSAFIPFHKIALSLTRLAIRKLTK